jgi:poly(hydroxyalkanoate) depolymerase family esterase
MKLNPGFLNSMQQSIALLRTRGAAEATKAIQRALRGAVGETAGETRSESRGEAASEALSKAQGLKAAFFRFAEVRAKAAVAPAARETGDEVEDRGHFGTLEYSNAAGRRQYRLYVPAGAGADPLPLIVMLHGCTQDADDFAAGTQMNVLAERHRCLVAYPVQPRQANPTKCWNWFKPADQQRERGEPSLIAGITREIIATHPVDPARVYVAGMSAGGAMAAIMIAAYPELYAALGVHSGLAAGCAHDLPSALAAMKGGMVSREEGPTTSHAHTPRRPTIVFHGDADATVNFGNARRILRGFDAGPDAPGEEHRDAGRRGYSVSRLTSCDGVDAELWTIHGAPHAWAGGSAQGSYTDPSGPNASAEMLRFFLEHRLRE